MHSSRAKSGSALALLSLLPAVALWLLSGPFVYRDVTGEPDVIRMINGVLYDHMSGSGGDASHMYGYSFSFGYYWLLGTLPPDILENAARLVASVNLMGRLSAALAVGALGLLIWRLHGLRSSLALCLLLAFSPMVLELSTYGHPLLLSATALFLGAYALLEAGSLATIPSLALGLLGGALLFSSLAIRSDSLLAFPWVAMIGPRAADRGMPRPRYLLRVCVLVAALAGFLLAQGAVAGAENHGVSAMQAFFSAFYHPRTILKGIVSLALGVGVVTCAATLALTTSLVRRHGMSSSLAPSLVLLALALAFWMPAPTPCRHFFYGLLAIGELFALASARLLSARATLGLAALAMVLNQIAGELLYRPVVALYPWAYEASSARRATGAVPFGASLPNHETLQGFFGELRQEGRDLARASARDVIVFADYDEYVVLGLLERGGVRSWRDTMEAGFRATRIERGEQTFHLVSKVLYWPRDVAADYLTRDPFPHAVLYVQPSTRSRFDREPLPGPARELRLRAN